MSDTARAVDAASLAELPLPMPDDGSDKNGRGRVLVVGGDTRVPGAVLLAGVAALRAGAGKLQIATCRSIAVALGLAVPEALVLPLAETADGGVAPDQAEILAPWAGRTDAILVGPGLLDGTNAAALTAGLLETARPHGTDSGGFVLDAGALVDLAAHRLLLHRHGGRIVLTPHAGEMAALLGVGRDEVEARPLQAARQAAALFQAVVVMKGACTWIVSPQGSAWAYRSGGVGLATSGSGDVLAGCIAGLLARGGPPVVAAIWGVWLHGSAGNLLAGRLGPLGFLARELAEHFPGLLAGIEAAGRTA
jgi:hydroxyethylthiazole kinase-like uncharacterized protein yjeF